MNKLNLPPFFIGQKVVYVTGINMPKYSTHIVSNVRRQVCGCYLIAINNVPIIEVGDFVGVVCVGCKKPLNKKTLSKNGWLSNSFRPFQQTSFPLLTLSKIKETEKEEILTAN